MNTEIARGFELPVGYLIELGIDYPAPPGWLEVSTYEEIAEFMRALGIPTVDWLGSLTPTSLRTNPIAPTKFYLKAYSLWFPPLPPTLITEDPTFDNLDTP